MRIADIQIGERHRKDMGDIEGLARSIDEIGLLHPVVVRPDGILVAGERRFWAWTSETLGMTSDEVHEALEVDHVRDFDGTMMDAKQTIADWINAHAANQQPDPEPVEG